MNPANPQIHSRTTAEEIWDVLSGGKSGPHMIQGVGAGFVPDISNMDVIDELIQIINTEAFNMAKLSQGGGYFCRHIFRCSSSRSG